MQDCLLGFQVLVWAVKHDEQGLARIMVNNHFAAVQAPEPLVSQIKV